MPEGLIHGGCQCGAVRYEANAAPVKVYVCHCTECQRQSASAFGISVIFRSEDVTLLQGELKYWSRYTDSGEMRCFFCAECGTRVWHGDKSIDGVISIKGGSLAASIDLKPTVHVWTSSKLPWVIIPDHCESFEQQPD